MLSYNYSVRYFSWGASLKHFSQYIFVVSTRSYTLKKKYTNSILLLVCVVFNNLNKKLQLGKTAHSLSEFLLLASFLSKILLKI